MKTTKTGNMTVYNSQQAINYINDKLDTRGFVQKDKGLFWQDVRNGHVVHYTTGNGKGTRYHFPQTDLDTYIKLMATPG